MLPVVGVLRVELHLAKLCLLLIGPVRGLQLFGTCARIHRRQEIAIPRSDRTGENLEPRQSERLNVLANDSLQQGVLLGATNR